ncbi:zinc finger protein 62 homolog [Topomyia yanbarensis]|uniref:zinc finger protein 62 homolog n=1 Tax=Topomyia yanbarensis TaxID=2498891 RepID=UPI00273A986E|nr:zinc finger protein 62 homolog [Topomyia yanbarensis]
MNATMHKMSEPCRFCLKPIERTTGIPITDAGLCTKIKIVFNFTLSDGETFPSTVCLSCYSKVTEFHSFHERVRLNQIELSDTSAVAAKLPLEDLNSVHGEDELQQVVWLNEQHIEQEEEETNLDELPSTLDVKVEMDDSDASEESDESITHKKQCVVINQSADTDTGELNRKSECREEKIEKYNEENRKISEFFNMTCKFCSETLGTFGRLRTHCRKVHNERAEVECCNRIFYVKCKIIEHINSHQDPKRFHCEICNRYYHSKDYLELHNKRIHSNDKEKPFVCDKCDKRFPKQKLLNAHLKAHIQVECSICNRKLANVYSLKVHMMMHADSLEQPKHICDTCGKEFPRKMALDQHIKRHMGINPEKRLQCNICNRWILGKRGLKKHLITVHCDRNQQFPCDICSQKYPNQRSLQIHKTGVHGEDKFECEFCGKRFKKSRNLKEHKASHTGETLYSCDLCGMTSNSNGNLYSHKKNKHPVEWLETKKKAMEKYYAKN